MAWSHDYSCSVSLALQSLALMAKSWSMVCFLLSLGLPGKKIMFPLFFIIVFQIAIAIIRLIVWFILFHVGIDFWIFPNYFIDSNNPIDSFFPLLEVTKRDDIFDFRMLLLRLASVAAIVYGTREFLKEPKSIDDFMNIYSEVSNDVFEWG